MRIREEIEKSEDVYKLALQATRGISKYIDMYVRHELTANTYNYMVAQAIRWLEAYKNYY